MSVKPKLNSTKKINILMWKENVVLTSHGSEWLLDGGPHTLEVGGLWLCTWMDYI